MCGCWIRRRRKGKTQQRRKDGFRERRLALELGVCGFTKQGPSCPLLSPLGPLSPLSPLLSTRECQCPPSDRCTVQQVCPSNWQPGWVLPLPLPLPISPSKFKPYPKPAPVKSQAKAQSPKLILPVLCSPSHSSKMSVNQPIIKCLASIITINVIYSKSKCPTKRPVVK